MPAMGIASRGGLARLRICSTALGQELEEVGQIEGVALYILRRDWCTDLLAAGHVSAELGEVRLGRAEQAGTQAEEGAAGERERGWDKESVKEETGRGTITKPWG